MAIHTVTTPIKRVVCCYLVFLNKLAVKEDWVIRMVEIRIRKEVFFLYYRFWQQVPVGYYHKSGLKESSSNNNAVVIQLLDMAMDTMLIKRAVVKDEIKEVAFIPFY